MHAALFVVLGLKCFFPPVCVSLQSADKSQKDSYYTLLSLFPSRDHTLGLLVIASVCVFVCENACVCLKRSRHREKTKRRIESTSLIGNVRKSTKANGREEEGAFVISLLCGGSRQVSPSLLALFTQQAERER